MMINAVESMPENGELTIITENDENNFIVKIKDTGKSIPDEDIIRIFDPFFSTKSSGVGLGLSICYGIVVSHGGIIEVESETSKGTTFTISLPIR
jgi:two-component system sporulation sensor kinase C